MPFTLAHPAAVLPLRRFCPRWLSLPGLVAGSVSPDLWYFGEFLGLDLLSHRWAGALIVDLPAGIALVMLFFYIRSPMFKLMPASSQPTLAPLRELPIGTPLAVAISVMLGIGTHLILDGASHKDGWLVLWMPTLLRPLFSIGDRCFRLYHFVWYSLSFLGMIWICLVVEGWRMPWGKNSHRVDVKLRDAAFLAALLVPFELIHHVVEGRWIHLVAGVVTAGVMLLLLWRGWRQA